MIEQHSTPAAGSRIDGFYARERHARRPPLLRLKKPPEEVRRAPYGWRAKALSFTISIPRVLYADSAAAGPSIDNALTCPGLTFIIFLANPSLYRHASAHT